MNLKRIFCALKQALHSTPSPRGGLGVGAALTLLLLASCTKEAVFPSSSGRPYDVLVLMDYGMCQRPVGQTLIDSVLHMPVPGIPQEEYSFDVSHWNPDSLDNILKLTRNVIAVDVNPKMYTHTKLRFMRNKYAMDQIWVTLQSPSEDSLTVYFQKYKKFLVDFLVKTEMNRQIVDMRTKNSSLVSQLSKELFGCTILAPEEINKSKKGEKFFWTSGDMGAGLVNLCMYSYPYTGPETFNKFYVLHKRDSVMYMNIPGEEEGMYMKTDTLYTDCKPTAVHGDYAYECRGLWYMENDFMGGPFVSLSRVDTTRNEVIVAEGFVYSPNGMKRRLIRRLEASLYTLMLPSEQGKKAEEFETTVEEEPNTRETKD